jgi:hypothetical protein
MLISLETLHFFMGAVSRVQDLQNLVNIEACLNGIQISRNHMTELTKFILNALAFAVKILIVPVVTHDCVVVDSLFFFTTSNFVGPNLTELSFQIVNIQFLDHKFVNLQSLIFVFDVNNSQQNLRG